jgi:6-phosphofructokinase 1
MRFFFSFKLDAHDSHLFTLQVSYWIRLQGHEVFHWMADQDWTYWADQVISQLSAADHLVAFVSGPLSGEQGNEIRTARQRETPLIVLECCQGGLSSVISHGQIIHFDEHGSSPRRAARRILELSGKDWLWSDGLPLAEPEIAPSGLFFHYEKQIVKKYSDGLDPRRPADAKQICNGLPTKWPMLEQPKELPSENPLKVAMVGRYQEGRVLVAADDRVGLDGVLKKEMYFEQAGPRTMVALPADKKNLTAGVLVVGGIAPGINAVIAGIVQRHCRYANEGGYPAGLTVYGFRSGFKGLLGDGKKATMLTRLQEGRPHVEAVPDVIDHMNEGGSILGTSRDPDLAQRAADPEKEPPWRILKTLVVKAADKKIGVLYVIGGDGGMRAAHALSQTARVVAEDYERRRENLDLVPYLRSLAVVGIPKTMDNDILWVWFSFGFQSAVERSTEFLRQLETESRSNPRLCVIQLFGSDSGFVAADAATAASGKCDLFLIPEESFTMEGVTKYLQKRMENRPYGVVVMAETAVPKDVEDYLRLDLDDPIAEKIGLRRSEKEALQRYVASGRRLRGPTPDELRSGALKVVSRVLEWNLQRSFPGLRMFANEPRHLIRAIPPSSSDVTHARRLGYLAVDGAMAGYREFMVSQWLTEYVMVPLSLVVLGRKRVPAGGAFLANARATTGQPNDLVS